jgi:hypothetical protein
MPSNRAILADIHELNLDPTKAHTKTGGHGRLVSHHKPVHPGTLEPQVVAVNVEPQPIDTENQEAQVEVEEPVKNALVEIETTNLPKKKKKFEKKETTSEV